MHFSKVFAAVLATLLYTAVNASPAASLKAVMSSEVAKRTPGNVYICPQTGWGGDCTTISAANSCNNLPDWQYDTQSIGPDEEATCTAFSDDWCSGSTWTFTYPGDSTGGWATDNPWGLAIASMYCDTTGGGGGGSGGSGGGIGSFDGLATYYDPNGGTGACGWTIQNWDYAVAIGAGHWDGGAHCGQTMTVNYNGASIQVTVADLCPGCQGSNGIDLTSGAIAGIDGNYVDDGVIGVTWSI